MKVEGKSSTLVCTCSRHFWCPELRPLSQPKILASEVADSYHKLIQSNSPHLQQGQLLGFL